jgi:hypothetical protein
VILATALPGLAQNGEGAGARSTMLSTDASTLLSTGFTYQGFLAREGSPLDDTCDFRLALGGTLGQPDATGVIASGAYQLAGGLWGAPGGEPTSVELARFEAWPEEATMHVQWETSQEIDNLGFNLYRSDAPNGQKSQLNEALIPSKVPPGSPFGAVYDWFDGHGLFPGQAYFYWLEAVDIYGGTKLFGPDQGTAEMWHQRYLPFVGK